MGNLSGTFAALAIWRQTVDGVILVKHIPYTGKKHVVHLLNGLEVGPGFPEGEDTEQIELKGDLTWR